VMFEIALSCGLLVAAGLMIKSVANLRMLDPHFETRGIFTARVAFPPTANDTAKQKQFFETLENRLTDTQSANPISLSTSLPGIGAWRSSFAIEGKAYARDRDYPDTWNMSVTSRFFELFSIPVRSGRAFTTQDRGDAPAVAMVNRAFAAKYFGGQDPVGRRIRFGGADSKNPWMTIVGVVADTYTGDNQQPLGEIVFRPFAQTFASPAFVSIRSGGDALALTRPVRDLVSTIDPDVAVFDVYSMEEALARPTWFVRVFGTMFAIFGLVALFLSGVGLYAVMAFSVRRRTRDIGIRVAIGAQTQHIMRMVLTQGALQLGIGMVFGLAFAAGVSRLVGAVLFDVQPRDPAVFVAVVSVLVGRGFLACIIPARRASKVDPILALRDS
jgi:predicted permease